MGCSSKDEKIMKLLDDVELKEKEIKQLNEMKSRLPFELLENEKLMSIIIVSNDQKIHYSIICKNSQKFTKIEENLYERHPEYIESENFFLVNGNKINKYKSLEENNIKNSDIITLFKYDEM
jgi:aspartate carbamoyltransferase regulatory subunit